MSAERCTCPDPWCAQHARCIFGHELIICDDDPAFCPTCGLDVMPRGACGVANPPPVTPYTEQETTNG